MRVFAAVAKQRSVSQAADELHITQPAVTKQLKVLARDYNVRLYRRSGRGIELTETGRVFLRDIRSILSQIEKLRGKFKREISDASVETLAVGGSYSPSVDLLPSLLANFRKTHPHVRISHRTDNKAAIERMILSSEIDIAVVNNFACNRSLVIEPYRREELVVFSSPKSVLSRKPKLDWQDLSRAPFVIRRPFRGQGAAEQFLGALRTQGLTPNIVLRCDSPESVKAAVKKNIGVGILFKETVAQELRKGEFKLLKIPPEKIFGQSIIIYRKNQPLSNIARDFLQLLRERQHGPAKRQKSPPTTEWKLTANAIKQAEANF